MPDYEITVAGRMGPVVASCLPGLCSVAPPLTVLHALVVDRGVALQLLGMLAEHRVTLIDVRIHHTPTPSLQLHTAPAVRLGRSPISNE